MAPSIENNNDGTGINNSNGDDDDPFDRVPIAGSYQRVSSSSSSTNDEDDGGGAVAVTVVVDDAATAASASLRNFLLLAVLFSANHGCVVSCLALASSRLGAAGAWQSGILYLVYSASSVSGATHVTKVLGARNAVALGMALYCGYVGCFYVATRLVSSSSAIDDDDSMRRLADAAVGIGAVLGGIGAGFLWTAQGAYFGHAGKDRAALLGETTEASNATLAGYFAFFYLAEELLLRLLSSFLVAGLGASWESIFGIYALIAIGSTMAMPLVRDYHHPRLASESDDDDDDDAGGGGSAFFRKATVAVKLLVEDPKMKHMIGLNASFGFASAFLNSYVNGQVLPVALDDPDSEYVGVLTSTVSVVAAGMSLVFGRFGGADRSNGTILVIGALCFGMVVAPFLIEPDATRYGWASLSAVYCLHGTGRATFEGTLRSTFADYFPTETEGAFANIVLQNGIAGGVGYILTFALTCETPGRYCIRYRDGSLHDVWTFEVIALASVALAVGGYLRASKLHRREREEQQQLRRRLRRRPRREDDDGHGRGSDDDFYDEVDDSDRGVAA